MKIENWETLLTEFPILDIGVEVLNILSEHGEAYIVGGTVRDLVIGNYHIHDVDIATNINMEVVESLFPTHDIGRNKDFGIVVINYKGMSIEVAQFRSDGEYSDGRRPDSVTLGVSFKEDCARRDLTINSMGLDKDGNVIDHYDGLNDITLKTIRTVGDPMKRFEEDQLRMLRAIRFATVLDFELKYETGHAIYHNAERIKNVSQERITNEILRVADEDGRVFAKYIKSMSGHRLMKFILPDLGLEDAIKDLDHNIDNWGINIAMLLYRHHNIKKVCKDLKLDNDTAGFVIFLSKRFQENRTELKQLLSLTPAQLRRIMRSPYWNLFSFTCELMCHDYQARVTFREVTMEIEKAYDKLETIVNGELVMKIRNISQGREVGEVLNDTIDWIVDNEISLDQMDDIIEHIKKPLD